MHGDRDRNGKLNDDGNNITQLQPQNHIDNISMTSRKSSLSLAQPIPMPDDCEGVEIVDGSHKIDIVLNPTDEHMANCNGDTIPADAPLRQGDDDRDAHIKTVL